MTAFQYAAKFVCGKPSADEVAPGVYFTAINVHNPTERDVVFRKRLRSPDVGRSRGPSRTISTRGSDAIRRLRSTARTSASTRPAERGS
jgi:hypothetical protein